MKRTATALAVLLAALAMLTSIYFVRPDWLRQPMLDLNRGLARLSAHSVQAGAHRIHYLDGGHGDAVVLLHGIFAEKDHWVDFARALGPGRRIVVPDLAGFGQSDRHERLAYDYAAQTRYLLEFLDAMGIQRAHLAGSSMGGTLAVLFAIEHPQRVASVALIGSPHGMRSPHPSEMDRLIDAGQAPLVARDAQGFERMLSLLFEKRPLLPYPILVAARDAAIHGAASNQRIWDAQLRNRHLLHERVAALRKPTLVLWGAQDRVFDASAVPLLQQRVADAEVHVMPGLGHLPMMEAPSDAARHYRAFLDRQAGGPA